MKTFKIVFVALFLLGMSEGLFATREITPSLKSLCVDKIANKFPCGGVLGGCFLSSEIISNLARLGEIDSFVNGEGKTFLRLAVDSYLLNPNLIVLIGDLIDNGADWNHEANDGRTPAFIAYGWNYMCVIRLMGNPDYGKRLFRGRLV